ncbi:MAG: SDR family oxidoreductase [Nitrospirae bacterium]|nr:SDR family oxidoreductase [Nitrospirota bacterium]MBF0519244.1 SDR family oxidoreductase [Nitrospirota bacterium]MBF0535776.1 SDR family oxidoreductase [Nitrospirota bacterium]MBF0617683.1 SDR family oxidoreductase [Nitrospirota bacterium]
MDFKAIQIGQKAEISHVISEEDVQRFVSLTGDDNLLHIDNDYASNTPLKKKVAHGMLSASFISTVVGTKLPGDGALLFRQNLDFLKPVSVGDGIRVIIEVIKKTDKTRVIELQTDVYNHHNEKIISGTAQVKVVETIKKYDQATVSEHVEKTALVVGASGGIGAAVCEKLLTNGWNIIAHYHKNQAAAEKLMKRMEPLNSKTLLVQADVEDEADVAKMFDKIERYGLNVSAIVYCASARIPNVKLKDIQWDLILKHFEVNVKGLFNIQKYAVPSMQKFKYGKIVALTSMAVEKPNADWIHYITAKSALNGFVKCLALSLAPKGIRVNLISPGMTDTELIVDIPEKVRLTTELQTPIGRIAQPKDIAGVVGFLLSPESDYLTGETLRVNGGQVMI